MLPHCRVDAATAAQIAAWRKPKGQARTTSQSVLIDRLVAHAKRTNFNPSTDCL